MAVLNSFFKIMKFDGAYVNDYGESIIVKNNIVFDGKGTSYHFYK